MNETNPAPLARLIQVVPRFRPDADGVGETALMLANALAKEYGIRSDFVVYNQPLARPVLEIAENFPHSLQRVTGSGAGPFDSALDRVSGSTGTAPTMLLHYVPYGFSPQGTPTWLPGCLERFTGRGGRLITLFHELYAAPRFLSRTLFSSWLQRRIFQRVLAASEFVFTSSEDFLSVIEKQNPRRRPARLIGICSSAGELDAPRPLDQRTRRLTVFGRFATRRDLYASHLDLLERVTQRLGIHEVADIGPLEDRAWIEKHVGSRLGQRLKIYATLDVDSVGRLLADSMVGALAYPYSLCGKSSVFAAYQAHGAAILLFPLPGVEELKEPGCWPIRAAELLMLPAGSPALVERMQEAATAGYREYDRHRSARSMCETLIPVLRMTESDARSPA